MKQIEPHIVFIRTTTGASAILLCSLLLLYSFSFGADHVNAAYSNNPAGFADSCALENNTTVLYGWAYDPNSATTPGVLPYVNVTVAGGVHTTASDRVGYRDAQINAWINGVYPGAPTSSVYGWRMPLSGLYKGSRNTISGVVVNNGAGANAALGINTGSPVDGDASKPYFAGGVIPDVCLGTVPAPAPAPAPTPAPAAPKTSTPKTTAPKTATPAVTVAPVVSTAADAVVSTGTTTATFKAPNGNAAKMFILYGTSAVNLDRSTEQQAVGDATTLITLQHLNARSTYAYQIVRVLGDQLVHSETAAFTTSGYNATLLFTTKDKKPVEGIKAELSKPAQKQTTGKDGKATFTDLPAGAYKPTFTYKGAKYTQEFSTASSEDSTPEPKTITLTKTVNVDALLTAASTAKPVQKSPIPWLLIISTPIALLALWFGRHVIVRYKNRTVLDYVDVPNVPSQPLPSNAVYGKQQAQEPVATHMGESLRDMVILSMAEEAAHKKQPPTPPPIVPGMQ